MELRSRSTRPSSVAFPGANGDRKTGERNMDVSLGPTIYAGERYGKMSERRRRRKNAPDLDQAARHVSEAYCSQMNILCILRSCYI
jgi:hypothetical protein